MDSSFSSVSELKNLYNLFTITEELLFSIPLNSDLVEKYMLLRESGLKKIGFPTQNNKLWELQKQAHLEIDQKHSSELAQIKELSEQLDSARQCFKELLDTSQKMLEFLKEIGNELGNTCNKVIKNSKESLNLNLPLNYSQVNSSVFTEFLATKEGVRTTLAEFLDKYRTEMKNYNELRLLNIENEKKMQAKTEDVQEKCRESYEKLIEDGKKSAEKEIEALKNAIKAQESKKNKEIQEIKDRYEREIRNLEEEKGLAIENLSASIRNSHRKELKDLELSFKVKESSLLEELDMATNSDTQVLKTLRENLEKMQIKVQDLREVLRAVTERTSSLYQKYAYRDELEGEFIDRKEEISRISDNKIWKQYSELLTQLDFMGLAFKKLGADNEWLIEQIDELSKGSRVAEGERSLYEDRGRSFEGKGFCYEQVISTLNANESIIKDFQDARSKLLKQFADAKRVYT